MLMQSFHRIPVHHNCLESTRPSIVCKHPSASLNGHRIQPGPNAHCWVVRAKQQHSCRELVKPGKPGTCILIPRSSISKTVPNYKRISTARSLIAMAHGSGNTGEDHRACLCSNMLLLCIEIESTSYQIDHCEENPAPKAGLHCTPCMESARTSLNIKTFR